MISREQIEELANHHEGPFVTIYVPVAKAGAEAAGNPIRLKSALQEAADRLEGMGWKQRPIDQLLEQARKFQSGENLDRYRGGSLAVFVAPGFFRIYHQPIDVAQTVEVGPRFHLRPLLPALAADGHYYILALSRKQTRLLSCTRRESRPVEVPDMPGSIEDALGREVADQYLQLHPSAAGARREGIFHGHGAGKDDSLDEERRYLQLIDEPLTRALLPSGSPLVIAAVEHTRALYSEVSAYPNILPQGLDGNPDHLSDDELREKAWPIVEPALKRPQEESIANYQKVAGTERATSVLADILAAAHQGRIMTLFLQDGANQWGVFDPMEQRLDVHDERQAGDDDLLDLAAVWTLISKGTIHILPQERMPAPAPAAAILRY
ncbi:MAG: hypothetical protein HPY44_16210 [Armatimonadetes bacterium]|nr:hypothetical protein [Armatimonadota bacterium]